MQPLFCMRYATFSRFWSFKTAIRRFCIGQFIKIKASDKKMELKFGKQNSNDYLCTRK